MAGRDPGPAEREAIGAAAAVILPQGCREALFNLAVQNCEHVFPDYNARFQFPGKTGQAALFKLIRAPFPRTRAYPNLANYYQHSPAFSFPLVFKFNWGGEGQTVTLINNEAELSQQIDIAEIYEISGWFGFVFQEYIPHHRRSLRVVVIHRQLFSYWRVQPRAHMFGDSLAAGAQVDPDSDPELQESAQLAVKQVCDQTGINLAGFDLIFPENQTTPTPLLLEVNYFFGRSGLGGSEAYYNLLEPQIDTWLSELGMDPAHTKCL